MAYMTYTIGIGRNIGSKPMSTKRWKEFQAGLLWAIRESRLEVFSHAQGAGKWQGNGEDCATVVAGGELSETMLAMLKGMLGRLARNFSQEAIALTIGTTDFVAAK